MISNDDVEKLINEAGTNTGKQDIKKAIDLSEKIVATGKIVTIELFYQAVAMAKEQIKETIHSLEMISKNISNENIYNLVDDCNENDFEAYINNFDHNSIDSCLSEIIEQIF